MKTILMLPIIIGASLNLCAGNVHSLAKFAVPIANAGPDKTIYLTQTSTATLDGSISSGDTYQWDEISTDYMSRAIITSPTSKVTTVTGLPQGVFYFRIKATVGGSSVYDSMKVIVDGFAPPKNSTLTLRLPLEKPDFTYMVNRRDDTTSYLCYQTGKGQYWDYYMPDGTTELALERDRLNGMMLDSMRGKLYTTIEDGYGASISGTTGDYYSRSTLTYGQSYAFDTLRTYVLDWKAYFPQDIATNFEPTAPDWGRVAINGMHGLDDGSGSTTIAFGKDSLDFVSTTMTADPITGLTGVTLGKSSDWVNKTHTVRIYLREGSQYPNQKGFVKVLLDGVQVYYCDSLLIGKTLMTDYYKLTGLYDYRTLITDPSNKTRHKKFSLVTMNADVWVMNATPTVDAGIDQTISSSSTTFTGTANDDGVSGNGTITSYKWTKISGGAATITSPNSSKTNVTGLINGIYQFKLTATDDSGNSGSDTVQVTINSVTPNNPPTANAGADLTITLPKNTVTLTGSGNDMDGSIASYQWSKISGPDSFAIAKPASSTTNISGLIQGYYLFELKVTDNGGLVGKDTVIVSVNPANIPPISNVGDDRIITLPKNSIVLPGGNSYDPDGTIVSYLWTEISGQIATITDDTSAQAGVWDLVQGIYQFQLKVVDNNGASSISILQVTVNPAANIPPTANAGTDQAITLPTNSISLTGTGVDTDGSIASYSWTKVSGTGGTITNSNKATATVTNLTAGTYQYQLAVTDNSGAVAKATVQVTVNPAPNVPPTANAGTDQTITLPTNSISLTGTGVDTDGSIASYSWTKVSGTGGTIANSNKATATVTNLTAGTYQYQLAVTDNSGAVAKDTVQVTVNPAANIPPTANAGTDQAITLPVNNVTLAGTGVDTDGSIASYSWTKVSGTGGTIANSNKATATVTNLTAGTYQYQLAVTDNSGAVAKDTVQVTVNPAANIPPTASAGTDQAITLPTNSISLTGTGVDTDGSIASYSWTKVSGPNSGTINNSNSASATVTGLTAGTYQYQLAVTDNSGAVAKATMQVTVNPAANIPPTANAGTDQAITLPVNNVTLAGTGVDTDGSIASYSWIKISGTGGTMSNGNKATATVTGLTAGTYQYQLAVTDNSGAVAKATVQVTVNPAANIPPTANAGTDQAITLPVNNVTLAGTGVDTDGSIASYSWTKVSGTGGTITNSNKATGTVTGLTAGTYQYQLAVTDNSGAVAKATVQVTVNPAANIPPTASAGTDQVITLPTNSISLTGTGVDTDGSIASYSWTKVSGTGGTIANSNKATATVTNLTAGTYQYQLAVTDNSGAVAKDTVQVTVNPAANIPPTANAGTDQAITLPVNNVTLAGTGVDTDGSIASYSWTKVSGTGGTIANSNKATATVTNLTAGTYQYQLAVTDNSGAVAKDTVQVTVNPAANIPPTANAGTDQAITLPVNNVTLAGTGVDTDGSIASYSWTKVSGTGGTIANSNKATATVTNLTAGTYQYQLAVTDNSGAVAKDTVQVTVNPAANIPPTASAGTDQAITLPTNSISLTGTGVDTDGSIASYSWTKVSGPNSGTINNSNSASATVTGLTAGTYQYQLAVTDNSGAVAKATMQVTVNPAANIPPTANAGTDQAITLPVNNVTLAGTGVDTDGSIASYSWTKISGTGGTMSNGNKATATVTGLTAGTYQYQLAVTDNSGAVAKATVQVTVNPAANIPPTANAGTDQAITLPVNNVTLAGTGVDTDGSIASYSWTKVSGTGGTITNSNKATGTVTGLTAGTYQYQLAVTDNSGAVAKATVQVTVNPAANIPPTASAGTDQVITLPTNSISLTGTGVDTDGSIASYSWTKVSGTGGTITYSNKATATVTGLTAGTYQYQLAVTDNSGAVAKATVQVTVNPAANIPPTASAGSDITTVPSNNSVTLIGSGSDADGTISSYSWKQISGPSVSNIGSDNLSSTPISGLIQGTYEFELTVTDNKGSEGKDTVQVTIGLERLATVTQESNLRIYPNPVHDIANLEVKAHHDNTNISIFIRDITGKVVYKNQFVSVSSTVKEKIDMSNLIKGVYVVTVYFDGIQNQSIKVVRM